MNSKDIDILSKLPTEYLVYLINQMSESLEFINSACEASTEWLIPANDIIKIIQKCNNLHWLKVIHAYVLRLLG